MTPPFFCDKIPVAEERMVLIMLYLLLIILFLAMLLLFMIAPGKGHTELKHIFYHRNLAHRGLHTKDKKIPENSLAAFRAACEADYGIELDIQLTKDEQIVVFHDDDLKRVCNIDNRVDFYTYQELQEFFLASTAEQIPLFSEVLKLVNGKVPLLIELKSGSKNSLLCRKAVELLKNYHGHFCIESFNPFIVRWFKKNAPYILRGQLSAPAKEFYEVAPKYQAFLLSHLLSNFLARPHFIAYHKQKHSLTVRLAESLGAMRIVWTVRKKDDHNHFEQLNDAVIFEHYLPNSRY